MFKARRFKSDDQKHIPCTRNFASVGGRGRSVGSTPVWIEAPSIQGRHCPGSQTYVHQPCFDNVSIHGTIQPISDDPGNGSGGTGGGQI